jgi:hypothetical protein
MTLLAIDPSTPALVSNSANTQLTSASFTPPAGSLILLLLGADNPTAGQDASYSTPTNTGTPITWTRRARKNTNAASTGGAGTDAGAEIWSGVGNGTAITVTVDRALVIVGGNNKAMQVLVLTDADTSNLDNVVASSSTSGLPTATLTGNNQYSMIIAASSDWTAGGNATAGSGQTFISQEHVASQTSFHFWRTTDLLAAAGSQTMNLTAPSGQQYNEVVLEVRNTGTPPLPDEGSANSDATGLMWDMGGLTMSDGSF